MLDPLADSEIVYVDVPLLEAPTVCAWMFAHPEQVRLPNAQHEHLPLPGPDGLLDLVHGAENQGFGWLLLDGPRQSRPYWLLDLYWTERPECSQEIVHLARLGSLPLLDLREELERLTGS